MSNVEDFIQDVGEMVYQPFSTQSAPYSVRWGNTRVLLHSSVYVAVGIPKLGELLLQEISRV
ncbi:hypothetical protein KFU94_01025 [Chloroflexi bacterium TSY]|nr:hypothetical protein [Chloroflexi bacterium TSY]